MILSVGFLDGQVIDAGEPQPGESVIIKLPILVSIGSKPVARIVMPLVRKADCYAVPAESPQFLDQTIFEFFRPFTLQKRNDLFTSIDEFRSIAPSRIR